MPRPLKHQSSQEIQTEVRAKIVAYITAALGLVAGLAWNDAIKALIEAIFPLQRNSVPAKFVYAVLITLVVVFVSVSLARGFTKAKRDNSA